MIVAKMDSFLNDWIDAIITTGYSDEASIS